MPISHTLLNLQKKIDNIFLKFDHSLLRMPKIIEIGEIIPAEKRFQKHNHHAYK